MVCTEKTTNQLDAAYEERFSIRPKNAWGADGTEFQITPQNTAVLTTSMYITYDLTPVNGPRHGRMRDVGFQEIDMETGALLFEWRWSDHWNITDVIQWPSGTEGSPETPWDPFHINSVHKDSAGNYLVSSRHTSTVGYINGQSGEFLWKLGGKQNMFEDLSGGTATSISMQHHARFLNGNSTITVFNNGVVPGRSDYQSKGMIIDLDLQAMTAKVRQEYLSPHNMGSNSRGSMQVLDSQNHVLLGFGINAGWAEYSIKGDLHCDVHYGPEAGFGTEEVLSYRVLKRSWIGRPKQPPDMVQKGSDVYISWNGATEVTIWTLLAADANISDHVALASVHNEGFETRIPLPANLTTASVRAVGLDRHGNTLGFTSTLDLGEAVEHVFQAPLVVHY